MSVAMPPTETLEIPSPLYRRLKLTAELKGLDSVSDLLTDWLSEEDRKRAAFTATIRRMKLLRERIAKRTGIQPDSTQLIREDRDSR